MCQNIKSSVTGTEGGIKLEGNELGKLANGWLIQNPVEAMGKYSGFYSEHNGCQWKISSKESV